MGGEDRPLVGEAGEYRELFFLRGGRGEMGEELETNWTCVTILKVTLQHTVF